MKMMLLALLVSLVLLLGCAGYSTPPAASAPSPPAPSTPSPSSVATPPSSSAASVQISGFAFSPATLTVAKGTTVTWTNADSVPHTVTSATGAFDSGSLSNGKTFSFTFNQAGTYAYRCNIHTSMTGQVIVTG